MSNKQIWEIDYYAEILDLRQKSRQLEEEMDQIVALSTLLPVKIQQLRKLLDEASDISEAALRVIESAGLSSAAPTVNRLEWLIVEIEKENREWTGY